ncbi:GNAT family N-acetyltransferase [Actinomycetospora straminea]|nr:GNAT family N-acetyltransferase [Actinomycetospora straminea]MDD7936791.1 GNAT family N-acetyltransferase [Actinomycetospora straminea]
MARDPAGHLAGFVDVAGDGGMHASLLDTTVAPEHRHGGVATALGDRAVTGARDAGCDWLHVDVVEPSPAPYLDACGLSTAAGLLRLR